MWVVLRIEALLGPKLNTVKIRFLEDNQCSVCQSKVRVTSLDIKGQAHPTVHLGGNL